jgi:hypothetical protein
VVRAGDTEFPLSRDPRVVARALNADPWLLWQVLRELGPLRIAAPWTSFKDGYYERIANDGSRAASVRVELGAYQWETAHHRGFASELEVAVAQADEALAGESIHWRLL